MPIPSTKLTDDQCADFVIELRLLMRRYRLTRVSVRDTLELQFGNAEHPETITFEEMTVDQTVTALYFHGIRQ